MTHNEENIDDRPLHTVTKEQLEQRLHEIFHGTRTPPVGEPSNWETMIQIYSFMYRVNPEQAERWAKNMRYLSGYRD